MAANAEGQRPRRGERLAILLDTHRQIAAAGFELESVTGLLVERSMELTGAEGALVSLIEGDELILARRRRHRRARSRPPR